MFILHRLQRKVFGLKCLTPWWGGILFLILHSLRKKIFWLGIWFGGFAEKKLFWGHDNEYGTTELYCNPHSKNPDWNALKWTLTTCFSRWVLRNDFLVGLVALFNSPLGQNSMAYSGFDWAKLTTDIDQLIFPSLYKEPWMKCLLVLVDTWHRPGLPNESFQPWPSFHGESLPFVFSGWIQWILQMLLTCYRPSQYFAKSLNVVCSICWIQWTADVSTWYSQWVDRALPSQSWIPAAAGPRHQYGPDIVTYC